MHPRLTVIVAQQHIAELRRAADHDRLVHTATTATGSHAVPAPRHVGPAPRHLAAGPVSFVRWLRHLEPRGDQAGDCK
jgi:hypothetical protein